MRRRQLVPGRTYPSARPDTISCILAGTFSACILNVRPLRHQPASRGNGYDSRRTVRGHDGDSSQLFRHLEGTSVVVGVVLSLRCGKKKLVKSSASWPARCCPLAAVPALRLVAVLSERVFLYLQGGLMTVVRTEATKTMNPHKIANTRSSIGRDCATCCAPPPLRRFPMLSRLLDDLSSTSPDLQRDLDVTRP